MDDEAAGISAARRWVVLKTVRGVELGILGGALSKEQEARYRVFDSRRSDLPRGAEPMLQEAAFVSEADEAVMRDCRDRLALEGRVLVRARELLRAHALPMKLVDVEYTLDRRKLFFYFTADQRVDFREYVRDLAKEFRVRIELRQIGVRDEAKTVGGVASCGRPCCCGAWMHGFSPINIRMVKEQNLVLNPIKISGICGRLMCCMSYEHDTYAALWKSLPAPGSKLKTAEGNYVFEGVDLPTECALVRGPDGRVIFLPVSRYQEFKDKVSRGEPWEEDGREAKAYYEKPLFLAQIARTRSITADKGRTDLAARKPKLDKPEKITVEEHIAARIAIAEEKSGPARPGRPGRQSRPGGQSRPDGSGRPSGQSMPGGQSRPAGSGRRRGGGPRQPGTAAQAPKQQTATRQKEQGPGKPVKPVKPVKELVKQQQPQQQQPQPRRRGRRGGQGQRGGSNNKQAPQGGKP
jgi:cell fate regulator YaaT (PSP1 superfamily)